MGVLIPSLQSGLLNQSSAQIVDGSLKFNETSGSYLTRTPSSNGNRKTWTWSCWCKIAKLPVSGTNGDRTLFSAVDTSNGGDDDAIRFIRSGITGGQSLYWSSSEYNVGDEEAIYTNAVLRDPNAFYHVVLIKDTTQSSLANGQMRMYINGVEQSLVESNAISQNAERAINSQIPHAIGDHYGQDRPWDGMMTQVYLIDGLSLGPGYFGFTDPLTNTWRPKKFKAEGTTLNDGTVWSSKVTGANNPANAFDGSLSSNMDNNGSAGTPIVLTASFTNVTSFRYYTSNSSAHDVSFSGGSVTTDAASSGWRTVSAPSSITSISWIHSNEPAAYVVIEAIEINGEILRDSTTTNLAFGTNGFYLPMDGNSPIGEDKSGRGNNWTPSGFGGSLELGNPNVSGAKPILNTDGGGNVARPGVFGSEVGAYYAVTVASVGGGNRYHFDGVDRPNPTLIRGATYTFDQSDSSNSGHPLRFATAADAAGSSQYTDGVVTNGTPGSAGAYTKITVPHNAPNTLHYYCTNHGGMGSSTSQTTDETKADPYAWKNTLALPLVGSANDVSNSVNSGSTTKTITVSGPVASTVQSNFYSGSFVFDGSNDRIITATDASLEFDGDFTFEAWANRTATGRECLFAQWLNSSSANRWRLELDKTSGKVTFVDGESNEQSFTYTSGVGTWNHWAITRSGNTAYIFENGNQIGTWTSTTNLGNGGDFTVGNTEDGGLWWQGYIQDVRAYKGVAKYTSNFVVPATSPDVLPDTPSGVSGSSKLTKVIDGAVHFDGTGDYLSLADSDDIDLTGSISFTVEAFIYKKDSAEDQIFEFRGGGSTGWTLYTTTSNTLQIYDSVANTQVGTSTGKIIPNAWNHIALTKNGSGSNNCDFWINGVNSGTFSLASFATTDSTGLRIGASKDTSAFFTGFMSNVRILKGTALYTSNFTPSTTPLTNVTNTKLLCCQSNTSANLTGVSPATFSNDGRTYSSGVTFSPGVLSSTRGGDKAFNGTISDNASASTNNPSLLTASFSANLTGVTSLKIYSGSNSSNAYINGASGSTVSITANNWTDLTSLASGASGTISSISVVTAGDNAQLAAVEVNGCILVDGLVGEALVRVGDTAATNFNPFNTDINTVRGQETDYCTINPLDGYVSTKDGNLETSTSSGWQSIRATLGMNSGKFYWETQNNQDASAILGIADSEATGFVDGSIFGSTGHGGGDANPAYTWAGANYYFNATTAGTGLSNHVPSDVVQYAFDADSGKLWFGRNGVWYSSSWGTTGNPAGGSNATVSGINTTKTYLACASFYNGSGKFNFGQKPFKFPPPDGFSPLNAANVLPETVITRPDKYVGATIWDGTGSARSIDIGTQPDLVWVKVRNHTYYHYLVDSVRGAGKELNSNTTDDEYTDTSNISAFNANGFSLGTGAGVNQSGGKNYVAWCWKAGGNKNTFNVDDVGYASAAAAGLDGGNINPNRASVGTKQGFSIIRYTGTDATSNTFSHGLTQKPDFAIFKNTSQDGDDWIVYHSSIGATKRLKLNSSNAADSQTSQFNDTEPTSSVFTIGTYDNINKLNNNYISYIWHNVPGLQKFGSVETVSDVGYAEIGFRPALVIFKNIDASSSWSIRDNKRVPYNPNDILLRADTAGEDFTSSGKVDFLSNGFKIQGSGFGSYTYIYAAWAEAPAFNLYGAQSNAR
jgi:hypothetical protein